MPIPHAMRRTTATVVGTRWNAVRRATERVVDATIAAGSGLAGTTVASTAVEVLAVVDADGRVVAPPPPEHALAVGDRVIAMGRPDALRSFDAAAQGTSP